MIAGGQTEQRRRFKPGPCKRFFKQVQRNHCIALADRTVDHACQTEAATVGASAQHFDANPVMNHLHVGRDDVLREGSTIE